MSLHQRYQSRTSLFHMLPPMLYNPRKLIMFLPMRIVISRSKTYTRKPSSKRNCQPYGSSRCLRTGEGRYSLQMQSQPNIMSAKTITNQNPHNTCDQDGLTKEKNGANFGANSLSAMMDRQPFNSSQEDFKQGKWLKEQRQPHARRHRTSDPRIRNEKQKLQQ